MTTREGAAGGRAVLAFDLYGTLVDEVDEVDEVGEVGAFKPSPVVYRHAAGRLSVTAGQVRLVTGNAFDRVGAGATACPRRWPADAAEAGGGGGRLGIRRRRARC